MTHNGSKKIFVPNLCQISATIGLTTRLFHSW